MDNKTIKELANKYDIEFNRAGTIINALEVNGCPADMIPDAVGEVLEIIKVEKCSPNAAVETWISQNQVSQAIHDIGDDLDLSVLQLSEEDKAAIEQLSDLRAANFKLTLDKRTAEKVCSGQFSDPKLQEALSQSGKLGNLLIQAAKKHYLLNGKQHSLNPSPVDITATTKL